jgi:anti-anti-sigma factor
VPLDLRLTTLDLGDDSYVCTLAGDLDTYTTELFEHELDRLHGLGAERVIVDLAAVGFMDSTGLGLLLRAARRLRANGGDLVVVTADPRLLRILEITGSDRRLTISETLREVVNDRSAGVR